MSKITDKHLAAFRDDLKRRGRKDGTIIRYFTLISAFFEWCRSEMKWVLSNPSKDVKKPPKPNPRDRRISSDEVDLIMAAAKLKFGEIPINKTQETALAWLIGMTTGMRSGEIINRSRAEVSLEVRSVFVAMSKTGSSRLVPLDQVAAKLWAIALQMHPKSDRIFSVSDSSRSSLWYKLRENAGLGHMNLTFHDSRHEAASQLSKRMTALPLAKIFGWINLKYAMVYYNPTHEELLEQVDSGHIGHKSFNCLQEANI